MNRHLAKLRYRLKDREGDETTVSQIYSKSVSQTGISSATATKLVDHTVKDHHGSDRKVWDRSISTKKANKTSTFSSVLGDLRYISSRSTQPQNRLTRSITSVTHLPKEHDLARTRPYSKSVTLPIGHNDGGILFTGSIAKRMERFRLTEELWHRHLRILSRESLSWRNRPKFWRVQLRGLQKRDFAPLARVAEGNFMKVFAVKSIHQLNPENRKVYALKILERINVQEEEIIKEFDVMLKLSHSNYFPCVYGFFFDRSYYQMCFVMDYLDGVCLMTLTYSILHPPKDPRHSQFDRIAHFYTVELVRAVAYLHYKISVPHGDLKNDNIMVTMNGHLKVFDFDYCGQYSLYHHSERFRRYDTRKHHAVKRYFKKEVRAIYPTFLPNSEQYQDIFRVVNISKVREQERRLKVRALTGHRAYRSPEYHAMTKKGELISRRRAIMSDWWAVGVLVYEMYMGIHPFSRKDPEHTYPRFRSMNVSDIIYFDAHPTLQHDFMAKRIGNEKIATFIRCLLTEESHRLGSKPMAADIRTKGIECGLFYFESEQLDPPFRPSVLTVEEMARVDGTCVSQANKVYKTVTKDNKTYRDYSFLSYAAF